MDFDSSIKRICVFGDSIVWGACDYEKGGWAERLKTDLLKQTDIDVYNFGVAGETTNNLLARFEMELGIMKPQVIIFAIGINDTKYMDDSKKSVVNLEDFRSNISTLIDISRKITNKIIFVGLTSVDESKTMPRIHNGKTSFRENAIIKDYDSAISSVCGVENVKFVNIFESLKSSGLEDGLHPNSQGHEIIYLKVRTGLEEFIGLR